LRHDVLIPLVSQFDRAFAWFPTATFASRDSHC
jgi:hypothetical protein